MPQAANVACSSALAHWRSLQGRVKQSFSSSLKTLAFSRHNLLKQIWRSGFMNQISDNLQKINDSEQKLYHVVDSANQPLCFLPVELIESQNLVGRSVACLIQIKKDKWLIDYNANAGLGFSCFSRLEAPFAPEEFCRLLALRSWRITAGKIVLLQKCVPCDANKNTYAWVYKVTPAYKGPFSPECQAASMTLTEVNALFDQGIPGEPFFKYFWASRLKRMSRSQK